MIDNLPEYIKLRNAYNPAHYPANKKISAEEWNALWLSVMYQGNHQEDILASILNVTLPEVITVVNEQGVQIDLYKDHIADEDIHLDEVQVERIADVPNKQDKVDNGLVTTDKAVVGAINHLETSRISMQENLDDINATVDYLYSTDNVVYVSKQTGDDIEGNGSKNKPYQTIIKALMVVGSKLTGPKSRAAIEISDADIYYENIALPHGVYLLGSSATIVGQIAVGNQCYINISRHYASENNQVMLSKQGVDMSLYVAYISDGRGIDGTLTGTTNLSNTTSSSILFAEINMVRVATNGFGCRDSANDWGHFHLDVSDFYLDTNAVGVYANSMGSYTVGTIDHILKMSGATNTKAIHMTGSTQVIALQCNEIKSDIAYEILLNPADFTKGLFLNCLSVHGEKLGPGKPSKDASVFTNNYNELINTPTKVSDFANDSAFQSLTEVNNLISTHNTSETNHSDIRAKLINNFTYNESDKILSLIYADTSSKNITLPVSSDTKDGLMPSGTLGTISSIIERITYLENSGVWKGTFDTLNDMPTHTPNPGFVGGSVNINDFIDISSDLDHGEQPTRYRIIEIDEGTGELTYQFVTILLATISLATNTKPGLFLGKDIDGKVSVESDGSGSVVGWDALKSRVTTVETDKVDKAIGYGLSQNDLTDTLKGYYDDAYSKRHEHSNKTLLDSYTQTELNLGDAVALKHSHDNKTILDLTSESFTTDLKTGYDNHLTNTSNPHGVTKAQVGLGNAENTADNTKNVLSATKLTTPRTIAGVSFDGTQNIDITADNLKRIKLRDYTGSGVTWRYYKLGTLPINNASNDSSFIVTGRIGGWIQSNMTMVNAILSNRGGAYGNLINLGYGTEGLDICRLQIYNQSDSSAIIYLAVKNYFTFDINVNTWNATVTYDGTYVTTPVGTLGWDSYTTQNSLRVYNGSAYAGTNRLPFEHMVDVQPYSAHYTTGGNGYRLVAKFDYSAAPTGDNRKVFRFKVKQGHGNGVSYVFWGDYIVGLGTSNQITCSGLLSKSDGTYGKCGYRVDAANHTIYFYIYTGQYSAYYTSDITSLTPGTNGTVTWYTGSGVTSDTVTEGVNSYYPTASGTLATTSQIPTNHVTTDTVQTITANKTLSGTVTITGTLVI